MTKRRDTPDPTSTYEQGIKALQELGAQKTVAMGHTANEREENSLDVESEDVTKNPTKVVKKKDQVTNADDDIKIKEMRAEFKDKFADHKTSIISWIAGIVIAGTLAIWAIVATSANDVKNTTKDIVTQTRDELLRKSDWLQNQVESQGQRISTIEIKIATPQQIPKSNKDMQPTR